MIRQIDFYNSQFLTACCLVLGLALLLSACAGGMTPPTQPIESAEPSPELPPATETLAPMTSQSPPILEVTVSPIPTSNVPVDPYLVSTAVNDLAARLEVPPESITLVKFEAVTWGDASLGCPDPDMAYIQVPVDGALIVLQAGETLYEYHSGGTSPPFLCEPGRSSKEIPPGLEITLPPPDINN